MAAFRATTKYANGTIPAWASTSSGGGAGTINVQGDKLRIVTPAVGGYNASGRVYCLRPFGGVSSGTDVDILMRIAPAGGTTWASEAFIGVGVGDNWTALTTNLANNGWVVSMSGPSTFVTDSRVSNVDTNLATPGFSFSGLATNTTPVWVRFRKTKVAGVVSLYGKIWADGATEPGSWTAGPTTDPAPYTGGNTMFPYFAVNTGNAATALTFDFDGIIIDDLVTADNLLNPGLDVSVSGWTTDTGATTNLWDAINEDSASQADYIQGVAGGVYEAQLEIGVDPASSTGHILDLEYKKSAATDTINLQAELIQGITSLKTRTYSAIGTTYTQDNYTLSGGEADTITDYTDLRIRLTVSGTVSDPAKVQDVASLNSTTAGTAFDYVLTGLTVGNFLIIRTAADNAGASGAAATVNVTNQSGTAIDATNAQKFQANADPGAASAGITCNVIVAKITATSGTVRLTYSTSLRQSGVAEEWPNFGTTAAAAIVGTPVTATAATTAQPTLTDASIASGNLVYVAVAVEGPSTDTYTADTDTTNGSWTTLTKVGQNSGTATNDTTTTGATKVVNATGSQSWNNATINNTRDSAGIIIEFTRPVPSALAVVSWEQFVKPAAGTTVTGSQASETDTGQAGTPIVTKAGAQATETDTGQAGVPRITKTGTQSTETDTAQAGVPRITKAGTQATETDTAQAGAPIITVAGSQVTETDTGQAGAALVAMVVTGTQATETDTAQAGAPIITVAGSQATETDEAEAGTALVAIVVAGTQATETDTAQAGAPIVTVAGSQVTEADTGVPGGALVAIAGSQAAETDTGAPGAVVATVAGSQAAETDTGQVGAPQVTVAGSQASETDTGQAGAPIVGVSIEGAQAVETDTAQAGAPIITVAGSQVTETDTAQAGAPIVGVTVTGAQAVETDTAFAGSAIVTVTGAQATEADTAQPGALRFVYPGTQATEVDTAAAGTPAVTKAGTQAVEVDTGQAGALRYTYPGAQATEVDTAQAGSLAVTLHGTQAVEVDTARPGRAIRPGAPVGIVEPTFVILADDGTLSATLADDGTLTVELDDDGTLTSVDTLLEVAP